ncbi:MAG TPA: hypothetical protein VGL23_17100 [Chloroflexota bacterium]|jgi:hypothetical protein
MKVSRRGGALLLGGVAVVGAVLVAGPEGVASAGLGPFRTVVNGAEQRPWFPCQPGQVKMDLLRREYLPPGHIRYDGTRLDTACAGTVADAQAPGFHSAE